MITRARESVRDNVVKSMDASRNIRANAIDYSLLPIITLRLKALDRLAPLDTTPADAFQKCSLPVNLPPNRIGAKLAPHHGKVTGQSVLEKTLHARRTEH